MIPLFKNIQRTRCKVPPIFYTITALLSILFEASHELMHNFTLQNVSVFYFINYNYNYGLNNNILRNTCTCRKMEVDYSEIKEILKDIKRDIKSIKDDSDIANVKPLFAGPEGFPLQTIEEFDAFEGDRNQQKKLV